MRRRLEEWWSLRNLPTIEFREGVTGPRAALEYYERFPEPIDELIQEKETTARFLADRIG